MSDKKAGLVSRLSKHVLGMKFMRKSKDQFEKDKVVQTHKRHFGFSNKETRISDETITETKEVFEVKEIPSFYQIERYSFGRVSYGGFNPEVESNTKKGLWRSEIAPELNHLIAKEEEEEEEAAIKAEYDVSDNEMADYGRNGQRKKKRQKFSRIN